MSKRIGKSKLPLAAPKPCPFCGQDKLGQNAFMLSYRVACKACGAFGPEDADAARSIDAWNTRINNE